MTPEIKQRIEQVQRGEVPEGYKKTKVGIIPNEWEETHFKTMFSRVTRKNKEGNDNVLTISAQYGLISQRDFFNKDIASEDKTNYYLLNNGEFAYNKSYSNGYPFGALKRLDMYDKGIVSPLYICFAATNKNKCPDFYLQYFEAGKMNREIQAFAQEGARNHGLLNIAVDDFFNSYIVAPSLTEQEKIAEILFTQDKLIELKEKLVEEKKKQKKALMQQLLTGEKRLPGFDNEWKDVLFKDCIAEIDERSTESNQYPILSVTKDGIVYQSEHFNKQIASDNNIGYKIVKRNQLAFSILNLWMGSVDVLSLCDIGIVSPAYKVFECVENILTPNFAKYFLRSYNVVWLYNVNSYTGASVVRKNLDLGSLLNEKFKLPSIKEQLAIANILVVADNEIELLKKELEQEKQKKKALMQLLLTGIVRVN